MKTCLEGLKRAIESNPRKSFRGYFVHNGRELTHQEVVNVANYGVEHGYYSEADIPEEEIELAMEGGDE